MTPKNAARVLFILAFAGLVVPWYFHAAFLLDGGSFAPGPFMAAVSANKLVAGITWDVYLAAAAFSVWLLRDASAARVRRPWIYVALTFGLGLAFALPLYMAMRKVAR
ncbi:hypothetical protein M2165_000303 [Variovorax sp. TBS-050B]|uniref:DUF2834 domain-containing protein n=1 Tax=Variovorax sp. TBS-050B TaxID=2940551 RepID=UPI002475F074|nr:DUF2834 domain-containing protein [Variovorax sp. TBS-050B]MDH6590414.1 hypothetical protein [Variovorax sp. TBS-050B]